MNRLLAMTTLSLLTVSTVPAAAEQSAAGRAEGLFQEGVERFQAGDFAGAFERFQASYDASPTPALRYNLGVCRYNLGQWVEARTELAAYLAEADPSLFTPERRAQVAAMEAEIDRQIGPASTPPPPPSPPSTPEPATVAEAPDQPSTNLPTETRRRISPGWFWATAGLAVALAAGGVVTGALVLSQESDFDALVEECAAGTRQGCYEDGVELRDRADALVVATNVLFASAGGVAVAALVLAFFTEWGGRGRLEVAGRRWEIEVASAGLRLDVSLRF